MEQIKIIGFIWENREVFATFIASLIAVVKLFAWGKAQSSALDAVTRAIERLGAVDVKKAVALSEMVLPNSAREALHDSVAKVDPKKTRLTFGQKIMREVGRMIF